MSSTRKADSGTDSRCPYRSSWFLGTEARKNNEEGESKSYYQQLSSTNKPVPWSTVNFCSLQASCLLLGGCLELVLRLLQQGFQKQAHTRDVLCTKSVNLDYHLPSLYHPKTSLQSQQRPAPQYLLLQVTVLCLCPSYRSRGDHISLIAVFSGVAFPGNSSYTKCYSSEILC